MYRNQASRPAREREVHRRLHHRVNDELERTVPLFADVAEHVVLFVHEQHAVEEIAEQHRADGERADEQRRNRQQDQRQRHDPRRSRAARPGRDGRGRRGRCHGAAAVSPCVVMCMIVVPMSRRRVMRVSQPACRRSCACSPCDVMRHLAEALRTVERHEHQTEAVERGDEHTEEHAPVRVGRARNVRSVHRFDQRVLREEARRAREADQRQRADGRRPIRDGHVLLAGRPSSACPARDACR